MKNNIYYVLSAKGMKESDNYTISELNISSQALMERAASGVANTVFEHREFGENILILCGFGNNGGDGFATAGFLSENEKYSVKICYLGKRDEEGFIDDNKMSVECSRQYHYAIDKKIPFINTDELEANLTTSTLVIDAVFGIGLSRAVEGEFEEAFDIVIKSNVPVLAVDLPSGLGTDTGKCLGKALPAKFTVAIQNLKPAHLLYPGSDLCGKIEVLDIGVKIPEFVEPVAKVTSENYLKKIMCNRTRRTNKGTYGKLCLICGSKGMSGAAYMASKAALRSGTGLVYIVTSEDNRTIIQSLIPEAIVITYSENNFDCEKIKDILERSDGFVIGCGLGNNDSSKKVMDFVLEEISNMNNKSVVLDADALNILSCHKEMWDYNFFKNQNNKIVITPHPAEMSRLCSVPVKEILDDPMKIANGFVKGKNICLVLKDAHTIIASKNNIPTINVTGNSGMAVGGSGDVLSGIIGALLVQNREKIFNTEGDSEFFNTVSSAVWLHGKAGNSASEKFGEIGMIATDIIDEVPFVTKKYSETKTHIYFK